MAYRISVAKSSPVLLPIVVSSVVILLFLPFARLHLDVHHDGYMFKAAADVADGGDLYRDTFMQYGPVTSWLQAAVIELFGRSIYTLRLFTVATYGCAAAVLALTWRRVLPLGPTAVAVFFWIAFADFFRADRPMYPWPSTVLLLCQGLVIYGRFRAIEGARWGNAFAGAFGAVAVFCRLPNGLALCLALVLTSFMGHGDRRRTLRGLGVGWLMVAFPITAYLAVTSGLDNFIEQTVMWPLFWATQSGHRLSGLALLVLRSTPTAVALVLVVVFGPKHRQWMPWIFMAIALTTALFLSPAERLVALSLASAAVGIAVYVRVVLGRSEASMTYIGLFLASSALTQIYPVFDSTHIWWSAAPILGFALAAVNSSLERSGVRFAALLTASAAVVIAAPTALVPVRTLAANTDVSVSEGGAVTHGMAAPFGTVAEMRPVLAALDRYPRQVPVLTLGRDAFWGTFSTAGNPDPATVSWAPRRPTLNERASYIKDRRPLIVSDSPEEASLICARFGYTLVAETTLHNWAEVRVILLAPTSRLPLPPAITMDAASASISDTGRCGTAPGQ